MQVCGVAVFIALSSHWLFFEGAFLRILAAVMPRISARGKHTAPSAIVQHRGKKQEN